MKLQRHLHFLYRLLSILADLFVVSTPPRSKTTVGPAGAGTPLTMFDGQWESMQALDQKFFIRMYHCMVFQNKGAAPYLFSGWVINGLKQTGFEIYYLAINAYMGIISLIFFH